MSSPTRTQYKLSRLIVRWYFDLYYRTPDDVGVAAMFCDPARVGYFAVDRESLVAGDGRALFRVLVAATMFQRRQDAQILRVLRGISEHDAQELTDANQLLQLADETQCDYLRTNAALLERCDLSKHPQTKQGICRSRPEVDCHLKRHTVRLKRYGHFGKVPTSAALNLRDNHVSDLAELRDAVLREFDEPVERAKALQRRISAAWRVSEKISAMFLSAVSNPDLSPGLAPWSEGIAWTQFVVIDSNVDLFLVRTGYQGPWTYSARAEFLRRLAGRVDLRDIGSRTGQYLFRYNPRMLQQAIYLFMSESNRRSSERDCSRSSGTACISCPRLLRRFCAVRSN